MLKRLGPSGRVGTDAHNQIVDHLNGLINVSAGAGTVQLPGQTLISPRNGRQSPRIVERPDTPVGGSTFTARITSATPAGANQWIYGFEEVHKSPASGYGVPWVATDGRTGVCYNRAEDPNTANGLCGNGVNAGGLAAGWAIQPCPVGRLVRINVEAVGDDVEYWFGHDNAVDGACEE